MSSINVPSSIKNTPQVWQKWISTLPTSLAQEIIDERPAPDQEDIEWMTNWKLVSTRPRKINIKELLSKSENLNNVARSPDNVINSINQKWNTKIPSDKKYDSNPARYSNYAKMNGATAKPSVMLNGEIIFGVGRFIAALLRGDQTLSVWDLRT